MPRNAAPALVSLYFCHPQPVNAYPAEYGNSGVMSFIVNHEGKVFQKDLGKNTASAAAAMKEYNPDKTWAEVKP